MSDNKSTSWTDREALAYLFSAIEFSNAKIDFANAPAPAGRNACGCSQKMGRLKTALRAEIDAIKNGEQVPAQPTPKKSGGRKRKDQDDCDANGQNESPKKRGRSKKVVSEPVVKDEAESKSETHEDDVEA